MEEITAVDPTHISPHQQARERLGSSQETYSAFKPFGDSVVPIDERKNIPSSTFIASTVTDFFCRTGCDISVEDFIAKTQEYPTRRQTMEPDSWQ